MKTSLTFKKFPDSFIIRRATGYPDLVGLIRSNDGGQFEVAKLCMGILNSEEKQLAVDVLNLCMPGIKAELSQCMTVVKLADDLLDMNGVSICADSNSENHYPLYFPKSGFRMELYPKSTI